MKDGDQDLLTLGAFLVPAAIGLIWLRQNKAGLICLAILATMFIVRYA